MKTRITTLLCLALFATTALATPLLRVDFYDAGKSPVGPVTSLRIGEIGTAYVIVSQADMRLGGASFRLTGLPPGIQPLDQNFRPGVVIGDLWSGVQIGLSDPINIYGDAEAVIAWFNFLTTDLCIAEFGPVPIPGETDVLLAHADGTLVVPYTLPGTIQVVLRPAIGLYLDAAGTVQEGSFVGGADEFRDVYMMIHDLDRPVDACFFSLGLPPSMEVTAVELPAGVTLNGDLMSAATLAFTPQLQAPGEARVLLARFTVRLGQEYLTDAELRVGAYESDGAGLPAVVIVPAQAYAAVSTPARISLPVGAERTTMSGLKATYR
ncbi:MAG TPA: hypothetical protein P5571_10580 [Candidatus Krumholzibacteria bacterium]|nr:hypothetical protein [Candidatus Krumholzibacteria bacterium]